MDTTVKEVTTTEVVQPHEKVVTTKHVTPPVRTEHPQRVFEKKKKIFRFNQVVWSILVFLEVLLMFRAAFMAIGANSASGFVSLIYGLTGVLVVPFQGIVPSTVSGNSVIEWATIISGIVLGLIAWGIAYLPQLIKPVTPTEVEQAVDPV